MAEDFFLTNLELRESTETGEVAAGLSHASMEGMFLLQVNELAARGEPRGAVTVVHDIGDHGGRYRDFAHKLAEVGWAVALPDMRGHGGSEGDRGHSAGIREIVRDLGEIQDHLAYRLPDSPKILIGQGLGAVHCLTFALERPGVIQALVLVAPLHEPRFEPPAPAKGLKRLFKKTGARSAGRIGYSADQLTSHPGARDAWAADPLTHDVITVRAAEQAAAAARSYLPRAAEAGVPILVVHGADDPLASPESSRAMSGDTIEVEIFEGLRHQPLHEQAEDVVVQSIIAWLDVHVPR